jgi:ABC-2 type transport system permease protein
MIAALYSLFRRNLTTRARLVSFGLAALAILAVAWVVGQGDHTEPLIDVGSTFVAEVVLSLYLPIAALVFGASAFGDLIEDHTLVYIWLRPIRRIVIVMAALLAAVSVVAPLSWLTGVGSALLIDSSSELILATTAATVIGAIAYCSLFLFLGYISKRPLLWGLVYLILWEGFIARASKGLNGTSISGYLHSIVEGFTDASMSRADFSLGTAIAVPLAIAAAALALLTWRVTRGSVD